MLRNTLFTLCFTQGRTTSPKTGAELSSEGYFAHCSIMCAEVRRVMLRSHFYSQSRPALEDTGVAGGETRQVMSGGRASVTSSSCALPGHCTLLTDCEWMAEHSFFCVAEARKRIKPSPLESSPRCVGERRVALLLYCNWCTVRMQKRTRCTLAFVDRSLRLKWASDSCYCGVICMKTQPVSLSGCGRCHWNLYDITTPCQPRARECPRSRRRG
jgi:hypothetical protein